MDMVVQTLHHTGRVGTVPRIAKEASIVPKNLVTGMVSKYRGSISESHTPSILLAIVQSIENKTEGLRARLL